MELDFHSFSTIFPHFIHTLNTLWNTLVFSSVNWLKLNFAWVIISIKAFLMQNLRLIALLVLEIWRHKIFLKRRERVIRFDYLYILLDPKLTPMSISTIFKQNKIFHFQNFWDVSMEKQQQQPLWLINFAKIWSECALRIKTKRHQVSASKSKRFLIVSCEFGHPGLWAPPPPPPPRPDRVKGSSNKMPKVKNYFLVNIYFT